jgi:hypothetical protein
MDLVEFRDEITSVRTFPDMLLEFNFNGAMASTSMNVR